MDQVLHTSHCIFPLHPSLPIPFRSPFSSHHIYQNPPTNPPGSFGTYPRAVRDVLRSFQDAHEARPDDFILYDYPKLNDDARIALAKVLPLPFHPPSPSPSTPSTLPTPLKPHQTKHPPI